MGLRGNAWDRDSRSHQSRTSETGRAKCPASKPHAFRDRSRIEAVIIRELATTGNSSPRFIIPRGLPLAVALSACPSLPFRAFAGIIVIWRSSARVLRTSKFNFAELTHTMSPKQATFPTRLMCRLALALLACTTPFLHINTATGGTAAAPTGLMCEMMARPESAQIADPAARTGLGRHLVGPGRHADGLSNPRRLQHGRDYPAPGRPVG